MIGLPAGTKVWLAASLTDMRSGFNGLAAKVQTALAEDPVCAYQSDLAARPISGSPSTFVQPSYFEVATAYGAAAWCAGLRRNVVKRGSEWSTSYLSNFRAIKSRSISLDETPVRCLF